MESAAQLALQGLPLILCLVAHELAAFRGEAVNRQRPNRAPSGNQCAALLAMMENPLLVTVTRLAGLEPSGRLRVRRRRIGHADRL